MDTDEHRQFNKGTWDCPLMGSLCLSVKSVANCDEAFRYFIHTSFIRRQKSLAVEIDARAHAAHVSRTRSVHFRGGDELFRLDGVVSGVVAAADAE